MAVRITLNFGTWKKYTSQLGTVIWQSQHLAAFFVEYFGEIGTKKYVLFVLAFVVDYGQYFLSSSHFEAKDICLYLF